MTPTMIRKKAQNLLSELGIDEAPIDVRFIAKKIGLEIIEAQLPDETSGILEKTNSGNNTVFINESHCKERKRFSIAHEVGHHILSNKEGLFVDKKIYFRDSVSQQATDIDEISANRFAAELLMPVHLVKRSLNKFIREGIIDLGEDVIYRLAEEFEVSTTAMSIRLQNLGISFHF